MHRNKNQRPRNNNPAARLRAMTFIDAAKKGYLFRWSIKRRCLELSTTYAGWRSVREMADYNRRIEYTQRLFNRCHGLKQPK